jgi:hypothetical protein
VKFFESLRPEVYLHGAKLRRDKKTGKRLWGLTLIVTLSPDLVAQCEGPIEQAYIYILTLDNAVAEIMLGAIVPYMSVGLFPLKDDKKAQVQIAGVDLTGLRLTRDGQTVEFWFQFEIENNHTLHAFLKEFAFTRVWAEFKPRQEELERMQAEAPKSIVDAVLDRAGSDQGFRETLAGMVGDGIESVSLQVQGRGPVVIDRAAAENIRKSAKKTKGPQ